MGACGSKPKANERGLGRAKDFAAKIGKTTTHGSGLSMFKEIRFRNHTEEDILIYVVPNPEGLMLVRSNTGLNADASGGAAAASLKVGGSYKAEFKARDEGGAKPQELRLAPGADSRAAVMGTSYITVVFYDEGVYKFAIENRRCLVNDTFTVLPRHLKSKIPFKTIAVKPEIQSF